MKKKIVVYALSPAGEILYLRIFDFEVEKEQEDALEHFLIAKNIANQCGGEYWMSAIEQLTIAKRDNCD